MLKTKATMVDKLIRLCLLYPLLAVVTMADIWYFVNTDVPSQPGWVILRDKFTTQQVKHIMVAATDEAWNILNISRTARPKFSHVVLTVRNIEWRGQKEIGSSTENRIYVPAGYIQYLWEYEGHAMNGNLRSLIYHHITHVWQWSGSCCTHDLVTRGVVEGIATYVPTVAPSVSTFNNCASDRWTPLPDPHWYDGWCQTALFFVFCSKEKEDFVAELNAKMEERNLYHDSFFVQLLGSTPDELWAAYLKQSSSLALAAS